MLPTKWRTTRNTGFTSKGNGNGDEWNISLDSFLKVTDGSETHDVWCVDITQLYPKGKSTSPVDALQVMPQEQLTKIAEIKMPDLNANDIEAAKKIIAGTARSMGVTVAE